MFNKVVLVGRLCADPEMKYTPSGVAVANIRVAVDRPFKNAAGERETDFIDVVAWRQTAEFVNKYIGKGRLVVVDGRLQVRQWQTPEGQRRREYSVVAEQVSPLDKPREQGDREAVAAHGAAPPRREAPGAEHDMMPDYEVPDITDPFADQ